MKQPDVSKRIQWPHWIDHEEQKVHVNVNSWISATGASMAVKKWYPGYQCELVSEDALARIEKEAREKE